MNTLVENGIKTLVAVCFSFSTRVDSDLGSFEHSNRSRRAIHLRLILKRSTARVIRVEKVERRNFTSHACMPLLNEFLLN